MKYHAVNTMKIRTNADKAVRPVKINLKATCALLYARKLLINFSKIIWHSLRHATLCSVRN